MKEAGVTIRMYKMGIVHANNLRYLQEKVSRDQTPIYYDPDHKRPCIKVDLNQSDWDAHPDLVGISSVLLVLRREES